MSMSNLLVQCETVQNTLYNGWGANTLEIENAPILDVLVSDANSRGVNINVSPGNGKLLDAKLTYFQRLKTSTVEEGTGFGCSSDNFIGNNSHTYTMDSDDYFAENASFSAKDLERFCQPSDTYFATVLNMLIDVVRRKNWQKTAQQAVALMGAYASDVQGVTNDFLRVQTLKSNGDPAPYTLEDIQLAATLNGYSNRGVILADQTLWKYMRRVAAGCCQDSGINLNEMLSQYGIPTMYDREVVNAFGGASERESLMFNLGALQLLTYTEAPWRDGMPYVREGSNYVHFTAYDISGVPYDVKVSDNCGKIVVSVKVTTKVVALPLDMYPVGDNREGVNFVNGIKTVDPS